eukprot:357844_1
MDISPVAIQNNQSRFTRFPTTHGHPPGPNPHPHLNGPPPGPHGQHGPYPPGPHGPQPPLDPHGHRNPHGPPHGPYPPGPHGPHPGPHGPPQSHRTSHGPYPHGPYPQPGPGPNPHPHGGPHGNGNMPPPGTHGYPPPHGHHPPPGPGNMPPHGGPPRGPPNRIPPNPPYGHGHVTSGPPPGPGTHPQPGGYGRDRSNGSQSKNSSSKDKDGIPKTTNEEFVNKVKEIERRIIQHLHQRGYDESHQDYHRYLQKAKELAIQKAGKEREKMLAQQREIAAQQTANQSKGVTRQEYEQYMRYRQEKQRQHAIAEQQRKQRLAEQQAAVRQQQNSSTGTKGGTNDNNKLTSPSKSSGSVKGLIVLRGLPGSGKTTLAKKLAQRSKNARICTEDRYHWSGKEDGVGEYKFQPQLVFLAREWCTKEIRECIQNNVNLIILDNHNARISMYEDHIQYAVEHGYRFRIIEFVATASLIDKYRARSYKKFPREVYVKLLKLWEHDPRTELINPTFGDNENVNKKEKSNKDKNDENISKKTSDKNDENSKDNEQESDNNLIDYSRRPLDQGLNISNKLTENK